MTKLVAFTGRLQSGKSSSANFMFGLELMSLELIDRFAMSKDGKLVVPTAGPDGKVVDSEIDMSLSVPKIENYEMYEFMSTKIWPYIKVYNFADPLKKFLMDVFDLTWEQCYGSNEDKNTPTKVLWENMPNRPNNRKKPMTARELMEYFGTDVCRKMYDNVWVEATLKQINQEQPEIAIIGDCRFPNEVDAIKNAGGKVIRLTLDGAPGNTHLSNTVLDADKYDWKNFDAVIDNANMDLDTKNDKILALMQGWDILSYKVKVEEGVYQNV